MSTNSRLAVLMQALCCTNVVFTMTTFSILLLAWGPCRLCTDALSKLLLQALLVVLPALPWPHT